MHNYIWCPYYLPCFMKFCSVVSEELHWQTVWRTGQMDRQTDGQDKNNMSPHKSGGRHNISYLTSQLPVVTKGSIILSSNPSPFFNKLNRWNLKKKCFFQELQQLIIACKFTVIYNSFFSRFHLLLNCGGGYDRKGGWWQGMKI